ncbi:hypothetical protein SAMN05444162_4671 [Paenibacillaceae bacterium GAS479]|nr:hypothetical protein SAMN05444162_4671 [Paenibacillaceae bacterium GAS479]
MNELLSVRFFPFREVTTTIAEALQATQILL